MEPRLAAGSAVKLLEGSCSPRALARGDLVALRHAGREPLLIKAVAAVPGDRWALAPTPDGAALHVTVNGERLRNSAGELYALPPQRARMLALYARSYPVVPAHSYLLLGEQPGGSEDATRFGLVHRDDIAGRVVAARADTPRDSR